MPSSRPLRKRVKELEEILAHENKILAIIKQELSDIRAEHGDDRKTEIVVDAEELDREDFIPNEEMVIMISSDGTSSASHWTPTSSSIGEGPGSSGLETKEGGPCGRSLRHDDSQLHHVLHEQGSGILAEGISHTRR